MSHRKSTQCPNCGNSRTGTGGGWRYCPVCGWTNKPKVKAQEIERKSPIKEIKPQPKLIRCNHIPKTDGRSIVCKKCGAVLDDKAVIKEKPEITTKSQVSNKAKTEIKKSKSQIALQR